MLKQIVSGTVYIDKINPITTDAIERILTNKFGEIIRWAIIEVTQDKLKICVSYSSSLEII
jgi:hypothetical protein